jgi:uncharacterized protein YrrD
MMEFDNGTSVYTLDGKQAGSLNRVVINPETKEITHVVVQKGLLSTEERVVPMEKVDSASHEQVALTCTSDELKEMSPLDVKQYEPRSQGENYDRMGGGVYASSSADPYVLKETIRTIPEDLVALREGARVLSDDNKHVGNIDQVFAESGKVTHFIATHGLLLKTKRAIPIEWVQTMSDDEVTLSVAAQQIDDLPRDQI